MDEDEPYLILRKYSLGLGYNQSCKLPSFTCQCTAFTLAEEEPPGVREVSSQDCSTITSTVLCISPFLVSPLFPESWSNSIPALASLSLEGKLWMGLNVLFWLVEENVKV
jgi:hypothetical protein